jgi:hypothetical protein
MADRKLVVQISYNFPYSRAEFFYALKDLTEAGIDIVKVDKEKQEILTKNVHILFMSQHRDLTGYRFDEIFGWRDRFNECFLKDPKKPRYSGTLVEYVKKLEENAITDAFLKSELDKIRKE